MMQCAFRFLSAWLLSFALALVLATPAEAQRAVQQVLDLNRQAMEAYNNLEIDQAERLLEQALAAAQRGRVRGAPLARTHINLGVVAIGGTGDNAAGLRHFIEALEADPSVELDPLTSTPDIRNTFALARQRTGAAGSGGGDASNTTSTTSAPASGGLSHIPVGEQLAQTAVPVYVEVEGSPTHVYLYYRAHGMREFRRVEMAPMAGGYGYEIPCTDVFEPEVGYYVVAFGSDGSPLGFTGSQTDPIVVSIVSSRTREAPALPGRAPPVQCGERECPPGMAGCHEGGRGAGESCTSDSQCSSGHCEDDLCTMGGESGGGGGGSSGAPRFFVRVGGGLGLSWVEPGMRADRVPCAPGDTECTDFALDTPTEIQGWPPYDGSYSYNPTLWSANGYVPVSGSTEAGGAETSCSGGLDDQGFGNQACLYVRDSGFVPNFQLRLEVGYFVLDWLGFSAFARVQPISGNGTLSMALVGARVHFRVYDVNPADGGSASGAFVHFHIGGSGGQIQVAVPNNGASAPYGQSGLGGFHVGSTIGYRFMQNVAIYVNPDFMFQVPQFLFTLDLTGGLEFGF
jgi:hypothetical protein